MARTHYIKKAQQRYATVPVLNEDGTQKRTPKMKNGVQMVSDATSIDELESARDDAASAIRELAGEKEESAQNMEDGFGHETEQSEELRDISEQLESWADDVEGVDFGDEPEPEDEDCGECGGMGCVYSDEESDEKVDCGECDASGSVKLEEPSEDQMEEFLDAARSDLEDTLGECLV